MSDSFAPNLEPMPGINRALWRFTPILPLVFGYELSYMEQVAKLTEKLNEVIQSDNGQATNIQRLYDAFVEMENSVKGNGDAWITAEMLADGAVTADKIASLAVGFNQLARGSVKGDRIASQSIESHHLNNRVIGAAHIMDGNVVNEKIADGHVTTEKLADDAVTTDKIASLAVGFDQLAKGSVKGDRIATQSIESYHLNNRVIGAAHIMDGNVVNEKIADGHITTEKLADGSVTGDKLAALSVGNAHLANQSVYGNKIKSMSIQGYHLANGTVTVTQLGDNAVQTSKIAYGAVTASKIAPGAVTAEKLGSTLKPLVLYAERYNVYPQAYINDSTYGDAALEAIMMGRPIFVRVPPRGFVEGGFTPEDCAAQTTALFSPVFTYQLPNNAENGYLYLFYLRDEKQVLDLRGVGMGTVEVPVYGQLKMKLSTSHIDCPLDNLTGQQYYDVLNGNIPQLP